MLAEACLHTSVCPGARAARTCRSSRCVTCVCLHSVCCFPTAAGVSGADKSRAALTLLRTQLRRRQTCGVRRGGEQHCHLCAGRTCTRWRCSPACHVRPPAPHRVAVHTPTAPLWTPVSMSQRVSATDSALKRCTPHLICGQFYSRQDVGSPATAARSAHFLVCSTCHQKSALLVALGLCCPFSRGYLKVAGMQF